MEPLNLIEAESVIASYGDGQFTVGGVRHEGSLLLMAGEVRPWDIASIDQLSLASLDAVLARADALDVLLIGCGAGAAMIAPEIRQAFKARGVVIDAMDTGAACRTYNILLSESRRVAAALVVV